MVKMRKLTSRKRAVPTVDELGGFGDGGLAIVLEDGTRIHVTPSRVATALRYFVARVHLHDNFGLPSRLALTSALVGEGVTYISRSLAAIIAYDSSAKVALVDLNWKRPTPETADGPPGLADAVERGVPVDDIIVRSANPRLCLVPPGAIAISRRPAVATSEELDAVLNDLESRFDHLLLDLPPVLATSDAMNLSQLADAFALVVRQGATSEAQIEAALEEMQGVQILGAILNRFDTSIPRRIRRLVGI